MNFLLSYINLFGKYSQKNFLYFLSNQIHIREIKMIKPISTIQSSFPSFKGMPKVAPKRYIYDADDAISQYEVLKHPQYTEIIQEAEQVTSDEFIRAEQIRKENYSFLDCLKSDKDKAKFVEYFKKLTGFPVMAESTKKMIDEFARVLDVSSRNMDYARPIEYQNAEDNGILMSGYDEFCSAGQGTVLPGSDLDKAFAVVTGPNTDYMSDKEFSDRFKGYIWENLDNRILSVNHCAAFPNIVTLNELATSLKTADDYAKNFLIGQNPVNFWRVKNLPYRLISGARFNIWLSGQIPSEAEKEEIKNLAYVVEAIRDGKKIKDVSTNTELGGKLYYIMQNSPFAQYSNIIQSNAMQFKYGMAWLSKDTVKEKLKARKEMEKVFYILGMEEQYMKK